MNSSLPALLAYLCPKAIGKKYFAIDVGAHCGEYTDYILNTGLIQKVIAFEPNPKSYNTLVSTMASKHGLGVFEVINAALSNESGTLSLYCDENSATGSLLNYDVVYTTTGVVENYTVAVLTLDGYLSDNITTDDNLALLKIDTQGNDLSVIQGASATITRYRPIIQVEFIYIPLYKGQCTPTELHEALLQMDYEMYSLNNLHVTTHGRLAFADAIFVPKELPLPTAQEYLCLDNQASLSQQIDILTQICSERLVVIEKLDAEVRRLTAAAAMPPTLWSQVLRKVKSWAQ